MYTSWRSRQGLAGMIETKTKFEGEPMSKTHAVSRRTLLKSAAGVLAASSLVAASRSAFAETALERIKAQGYIRVGFANEAPYGFATPDGKLTGEAPEVAKAVLANMGITQVDGVLTEFGSLIPGLRPAASTSSPPACSSV